MAAGSAPPTGLALGVAFAAGAGVALQAYVNGRLGGSLGSAGLASFVNNVLGLALLVGAGLVTGAFARGRRRAAAAEDRPAWWHFLGGPAGATLVLVSAVAAPQVGVAVLTVALVCGQAVGSVAVDRAGLSPGGRRPLTAGRLLGAALAIVAVALAAIGSRGDQHVGLLVLAVLVGAGVALQQAANGQLARRTGEPLAAGTVNFTFGMLVLAPAAVVAVAGGAGLTPARALEWVGGALGALAVVAGAWTVAALGVLRLTLAVVAGQSLGALMLDLAAPARGGEVTLATVAGVLLTFVAVFVSGRERRAAAAAR